MSGEDLAESNGLSGRETGDRVMHGDCRAVLRTLPDNCVDSIVTDPPCNLSFMGKSWDTFGHRDTFIAFMTEVFTEALRVIKPGGHALVWSLPRTSGWTQRALEEAGWETRDCIHHIYSTDMALHDFLVSLSPEQQEAFERLVDSQASSTLYHLFGSGFPKSLDVSKAIDKYFDAEREVVGEGPYASRRPQRDTRAVNTYHDGVGDYGSSLITAPATDEARQWQGYGTALKPAAEHWILCRKPLSERSVAENVLRWGTGALNIDKSRIGNERIQTHGMRNGTGNSLLWSEFQSPDEYKGNTHQGRWPANLLLSHTLFCTEEQCAEGCPVLALDMQSGIRKSGDLQPWHKASGIPGNSLSDSKDGSLNSRHGASYGDQGGASRYFQHFYYCPKASPAERDAGCETLPEQPAFDKNTSRQIAHVNHETGHTTYTEYTPSQRRNHHPTVKPVKLLNYLLSLITPPGGTVLDCFAGSGSTGIAAIQSGLHYLLIEQEAEYVEIAHARLAYTQQQSGIYCNR